MLKLISKTVYEVGDYILTVRGLNSAVLSEILPICSAMDQKVKQKVLDIAKDDDLAQLMKKLSEGDPSKLTPEELVKLTAFTSAQDDSFTLQECLQLFDSWKECIVSVTDKESEENVTEEFLQEVVSVPSYMKSLSNVVYEEYKAATQISIAKKI